MAGPKTASAQLRNFIATTQGKSYTVGAVTVLLVLVIFLIGIFPALSSIFLQAQTNGSRTDALASIETKRVTLRALTSEEAAKHALTLSLNANLPDTLDQTGLFTEMNNIVASSGTYLISITFNDLDSRRDFVSAFNASLALDGRLMNVSVEGDRSQIESMLTQIEASRRIMNIRSFSEFKKDDTSTISGGPSTGSFRLDMQIEVYFWNADKTK